MACFHFNAPYCLSTIQEDHAGFYKRIYRSRPIGDARPYRGVINCFALLYQADVLAIREETYARFPFFKSTPMEQRLMFSKPPTRRKRPADHPADREILSRRRLTGRQRPLPFPAKAN